MAGSTVGALRVVLGANTANFEAGMKRAKREAATSATAIQRSLSGIRGSLGAATAGLVGGAALSGLVSLSKRALEYASSLGETAQQLGVTTEALQVFRYAGSQVGITNEEMDTSLKKLSDSIAEAGQGSKAQATAFNELGVNVKLANGELKSTDRVIREMADGFKKLKNPADQVRLGIDLMGRAGSKMVPLLAGGSAAIDNLRKAAHDLGIVLSEEQIRNADKTADKLSELKQVLEARIAGVVSDNASAIYDLANSLANLANIALKAASAWTQFASKVGGGSTFAGAGLMAGPLGILTAPQALKNWLDKRGKDQGVTIDLPPAKPFVPIKGALGLNAIAGGGGRKGGGRDKTAELERLREQALRKAYDQDRDLNDAKADELDAQKDLLTDYVDRAAIDRQLIDIQADQRNKEIDLSVALGDRTAVVAAQLKTYNESLRILKKQEVAHQLELDRQRDFEATEQLQFNIQRDLMEAQRNLAETAAERRQIELEILDLAYRERKERLERIVQESKDAEEVHRAQLELASLPKQRALDTAGVLQGTRGPLEDFQAGLPTTAAKMNEALQNVAVDGLRSLEDGILSVIDGTKSLAGAFRDMASQIIADLLRIQIQRSIIGPLSNLLGGALGAGSGGVISSLAGASRSLIAANPGIFASGGYTGNMPAHRVAGFVHGQEYVFDADATRRIGIGNLERIRRGLPTAANDRSTRGGDIIHLGGININAPMKPKEARESAAQFATAFQNRLAMRKRQGY